jgi:hypothetical protein
MCNFFSCIVTKNGDVLWDPMLDSHETIIEKYEGDHDLTDDTCDKSELKFARIEITPPNNDVFKPISEWDFKIDQSITPDWWSEFYKKSAIDVLEKFMKSAIKIGQEIKLLSDGRFFVNDCKIDEINNCMVVLCGGTVNAIRGGTVNEIRGGTVNAIWGGTVNAIRGGTVNAIRGGTVNVIRGGTVNAIWGGTVNAIWGGTVNVIWGGTVNEIRGGTVNAIRGGTVNEICGGTVNEIRGGTVTYYTDMKRDIKENGIAILRYGSDVKIEVANEDIKIKYV